MNHPERYPDQQQAPTFQYETPSPQSWKSYVQQLGEQFQVRITEPDTRLVLSGQDSQRRLLIGTQRTFAIVSHGQTTEDYELLPDEEICFDIAAEGDWVASEIMYSVEALDDYQKKLRQSDLPPMNELHFDVESFAAYMLDKVTREEWLARI